MYNKEASEETDLITVTERKLLKVVTTLINITDSCFQIKI